METHWEQIRDFGSKRTRISIKRSLLLSTKMANVQVEKEGCFGASNVIRQAFFLLPIGV